MFTSGEIRADQSTTLAAGTPIGKYVIVSVLGTGAFGITYRAIDRHLHREVAIKEYLPAGFAVRQPDLMVLPRATQAAESFRWGRDRFLEEARTLARLSDARGVVDVFDFLEANGTAYMVMALVRGETLETKLKRGGRVPQATIEQILYPLLDGLEKVHEARFLHRDIKPANILINESGQPTLIDFGAARTALHGRTQAMTAIYTPGYAAFEQFSSDTQGPWTDIYALGATLYHCINGDPPPAAIDRMIVDRLMPAVEVGAGRYAPSLLAGMDAAMRLRPGERPQSIARWREILSGRSPSTPVTAATAAPRRTAASSRSRHTIRLAAAAAILVCLASGGAYVWQQTLESNRRTIEEKLRSEAEARRRAGDVAQKGAEERARADAEARRRAEQAAEERARAEAEARLRAEEVAARQATAERARQEAEAKRKADEAAARLAAEEKARADARAGAGVTQPPSAPSKPPPSRPPDFPLDRWTLRDLALLKGCWRERPSPTTLRLPNGRVAHGMARVGVCVDRRGHGTMEQISEFAGYPPIHCRTSISYAFLADGRLQFRTAFNRCNPAPIAIPATTGVCRRVSDGVLMCSNNSSPGEQEMRRASY